jgi:hypothetical protein
VNDTVSSGVRQQLATKAVPVLEIADLPHRFRLMGRQNPASFRPGQVDQVYRMFDEVTGADHSDGLVSLVEQLSLPNEIWPGEVVVTFLLTEHSSVWVKLGRRFLLALGARRLGDEENSLPSGTEVELPGAVRRLEVPGLAAACRNHFWR